MKKILIYMLLAALLLGVSATEVMADGNETLGDPSIDIATGSGVVANGTGLFISGTGTIKIDVPIGTTVKQVLLYWEGQQNFPGIGDNSIIVNSNSTTGTLIGGPTYFFGNVLSSTYRADITNLELIIPGSNTLSVSGLEFDYASNGAGILVIYDDGSNSDIILKDGNDLAYAGIWSGSGSFPPPLNTTVEQEFNFTAANSDRTANITMFFSSVSGNASKYGFRPSVINITVDGTTTQIIDQLDSKNGQEWDTLIVNDIAIPAGVSSLTVQALSIAQPGDTRDPASFAWNAAALSLSLPASTGTGTPGYWKNHPEAWPVNSITIGETIYTKDQAIAFMKQSVRGNKTYTMFPALVSAKLNVMIGNNASCIADTIEEADDWMYENLIGSEVPGSSQAWKDGEPLYIMLDNYNNGLLCAPHRD